MPGLQIEDGQLVLPKNEVDYEALYAQADADNGLPSGLTKAIATAETQGQKNRDSAVSNKGAMGHMQFMPATAKRYGVQDPNDPSQAIPGAGRYLRDLYQRFDGDLDKTIAGYNAGEGNVDKYNGIPPFKETRNYVQKVKAGLQDVQPMMSPFEQGMMDAQRASQPQPIFVESAGFPDLNPDDSPAIVSQQGKSAHPVDKVDPRLTSILKVAAKYMPDYEVRLDSGFRAGDKRQHGKHHALDVELWDKRTGKKVPDYQSAEAFRTYEQFAQTAKQIQEQMYPELNDSFRWGGYFSGKKGKYGAVDLMHFDVESGLGMLGGSWDTGLSPQQRKLFPGVMSEGMRRQQVALTTPDGRINMSNLVDVTDQFQPAQPEAQPAPLPARDRTMGDVVSDYGAYATDALGGLATGAGWAAKKVGGLINDAAGVASDFGYNRVGEALNKTGGFVSNTVGKSLTDTGEFMANMADYGLTEKGKSDAETSIFSDMVINPATGKTETNWAFNPEAIAPSLYKSLPYMAVGGIAGYGLKAGLNLTKLAPKATQWMTEMGVPAETAKKAVEYVSTGAPFAAGEGVVAGLNAGAEQETKVLNTPIGDLWKIPEFRELVGSLPRIGDGMTRGRLAREKWADMAGKDAFAQVFGSTAAFGVLSGGGALGSFEREAGDGIIKSGFRGVASETPEEIGQGGSEKFVENKIAKEYIDRGQPLFEGVLQAGASEGLVGGITGGGIGAAHGYFDPKRKAPEAPPQDQTTTSTEPGTTGKTITPEDLYAGATRRMRDIDRRLNGTPDQRVVDPVTGKEQVIPGEKPNYTTKEEQDELEFLKANIDNPEALAKAYGFTLGETNAQNTDVSSQGNDAPGREGDQVAAQTARQGGEGGIQPADTAPVDPLAQSIDAAQGPQIAPEIRQSPDGQFQIVDANTGTAISKHPTDADAFEALDQLNADLQQTPPTATTETPNGQNVSAAPVGKIQTGSQPEAGTILPESLDGSTQLQGAGQETQPQGHHGLNLPAGGQGIPGTSPLSGQEFWSRLDLPEREAFANGFNAPGIANLPWEQLPQPVQQNIQQRLDNAYQGTRTTGGAGAAPQAGQSATQGTGATMPQGTATTNPAVATATGGVSQAGDITSQAPGITPQTVLTGGTNATDTQGSAGAQVGGTAAGSQGIAGGEQRPAVPAGNAAGTGVGGQLDGAAQQSTVAQGELGGQPDDARTLERQPQQNTKDYWDNLDTTSKAAWAEELGMPKIQTQSWEQMPIQARRLIKGVSRPTTEKSSAAQLTARQESELRGQNAVQKKLGKPEITPEQYLAQSQGTGSVDALGPENDQNVIDALNYGTDLINEGIAKDRANLEKFKSRVLGRLFRGAKIDQGKLERAVKRRERTAFHVPRQRVRKATSLPRRGFVQRKVAESVGKVLGLKIIYVEAEDGKSQLSFDGTIIGRYNRHVLIAKDAKDAIPRVVLHEALHTLRRRMPQVYANLANSLREVYTPTAVAKHLEERGYDTTLPSVKLDDPRFMTDENQNEEEWVADFFSDTASKPRTLLRVAAVMNRNKPGAGAAFLRHLDNFITTIYSKLSGAGFGAEAAVARANLQRAQDAVTEALARYAEVQQTGVEPEYDGPEILESKKRKPDLQGGEEFTKRENVADYQMEVERKDRATKATASLSEDEKAAITKAATEAGADPKAAMAAARDTKKRFPQSAGWDAPTAIDVEIKDGKKGEKIPVIKWAKIPYRFHLEPGQDSARKGVNKALAKKIADKMVKEVEAVIQRAKKGDKNAAVIMGHANWYRKMAERLRAEFGGFADIFADLLGATSPNTAVEQNWNNAIDVLKRFVRGDFDSQLNEFEQWLKDGKSVNDFKDSRPEQLITRITGAKYGMNSDKAMKALLGLWRAVKKGDAPKARNFALNLVALSDKATIDVWAARFLQRLAGYPRIPTVSEDAVQGSHLTNPDNVGGAFGFGQEAFEQAAATLRSHGLDIRAPDLQAIVWFLEKEYWTENNWTSKAGEGGSFEEQLDKAPAAAWQAGYTIAKSGGDPTDAEMSAEAKRVSPVLKNDPDVIAYRILPTKGLYAGWPERSFDHEVIATKEWDPSKWISTLAEGAQREEQYDIFISRKLGLDESHPNARPGIEVAFKRELTPEEVQPIMDTIVGKGVDGFTLTVNPIHSRTFGDLGGDPGKYAGLRLQYVPEIFLRAVNEGWASLDDANIAEEHRRLTSGDATLIQQALDDKRHKMDDAVAALDGREDIAHAKLYDYSTLVIGKENYGDYIGQNKGLDSPFREEQSGQSVSQRLEAAARRLREGPQSVSGGNVLQRESGGPDIPASNRRPDGAGNERAGSSVATGDRPGYGQTKRGGIRAVGVHYSSTERQELDGSFYGTGATGAEAERVKNAADKRLANRIYFYINAGQGVSPEQGVGGNAHTVLLKNLYDIDADPLHIAENIAGANAEARDNNMESAIIDAGFDGYVADFGNQRAAVLIGDHKVPVRFEGQGRPQVEPGERAEPNANKRLAKLMGQDWSRKTPEAWGEYVKSRNPFLYERYAASFVGTGEKFWPDEMASRAKKGAKPDIPASNRRQIAQKEYEGVVARYKGTDQWLKAPNGKPTNLTERQWVQVRTNSFKAWFGDWEQFANGTDGNGVWTDDAKLVSKVVDENGEPKVVYHGTKQGGFTILDPDKGDGHRSPMVFTAGTRNTSRSYSGSGTEIDMPEAFEPTDTAGYEKLGYTFEEDEDGRVTVINPDGSEVTVRSWEKALAEAKADLEFQGYPEAEEQRGIYSLFLNIRNPYETHFQGGNWDGSMEGWYVVEDESGEIMEREDNGASIFTYEDARDFAEELGGEDAGYQVSGAPETGETTNTAAEDARRYGHDGAIIREVVDDGGQGGYVEADDVFVIFDARQAKSATQNTGEFGPSMDLRFSNKRNPTFYSQLAKGFESSKMNSMPGSQWKAWLFSNKAKMGIKDDEIAWTGIEDYLTLNAKEKLTKAEIADYLSQNGVQVQEVMKSEAGVRVTQAMIDDAEAREDWAEANRLTRLMEEQEVGDFSDGDGIGATTKFSTYTIPGGTNYRELLITLADRSESFRQWYDRKLGDIKPFDEMTDAEEEFARNEYAREELGNRNKDYRSSHWDEPNVLAHLRFDERTDADGNRVMFITEIQSDWGQEGKRKGFATGPQKRWVVYDKADTRMFKEPIGFFNTEAEAKSFAKANNGTISQKTIEVPGVTPAPFVTDTKAWVSLALKRAIRYASENGFDKIAFANGQQNADLYDLSKQVDEIAVMPKADGSRAVRLELAAGQSIKLMVDDKGIVSNAFASGAEFAGKPLDEVVGKDVADRILATEKDTKLSGVDLKVGGEGMRAFYDTIVPSVANDVLKKLGGGRVGQVTVSVADPIMDPVTGDKLAHATMDQPGFTITPALQDKAISGMPLFSNKRNVLGQSALSTWTMPDDSKLERWTYLLQDKHIDTKRVVERLKSKVADAWDPYLKETLYHGRAAKDVDDFKVGEVRPLLQAMSTRGITIGELETFLWNRHAPEANAQIAKINPAYPDGGSGIKTQDARDYLANLPAGKRTDLEALAAQIDAITAGTRRLLVESGLETQDTIDAWEATYSDYIPLQRETDDLAQKGMGTGQGFSTKGSASKRRTGSGRAVEDILANVMMQRERAITRAEKNKVGLALYGLAIQNPNPEFWYPVNPDAVKRPAKVAQELVNMGMLDTDLAGIIQEPTVAQINPRTGLVEYVINPLLRNRDNVLAVRIKGKDRFLFFSTENERAIRMAQSLKNLDAPEMHGLMNAFRMVTRYISSINTQYNPIFGAVNLIRDTGAGLLNLSTTPLAGKQAKVMANIVPALAGIYGDLRADRKGKPRKSSQWSQLWEEFQAVGGKTGYRDMYATAEERAKALESELKKIQDGAVKRLTRGLFDWLSDYNETLENAVRLSAYEVAIRPTKYGGAGMTKERAAVMAKELTVNFNRKGQIASQAGSLYAFFNAAVQGTARLAETVKGPAGKKIVAGGLLMGVVQAVLLAAAGYDDDEPPEFVRERNFIIPLPNGKYVNIPLPLGFHVLPNTGRVITESFMDPDEAGKKIAGLLGSYFEAFNPIGSAGWSVQTIAPTFADPLVALSENRDSFGKEIAKKDRSQTNPTPGFTRTKDTASWLSKNLAWGINRLTGGTDYVQGALSPTPDQLDFLFGQATGGVGREVLKLEQAREAFFTGEELPPYKYPLGVGRFVGDTKSQSADANRFYANITRLNEYENEIKGRAKDGKDVAGFMKDNPESRLVSAGNSAERAVTELRSRKRKLIEQKAPKATIKALEGQIAQQMKALNDQVKMTRMQRLR